MRNASVAVIMSVYSNDKSSLIEGAVESIVMQTYENLQLYLGVDGPIPCELRELLISLDRKYSCIKLIFFNLNRGLASTLNDLIEMVLEQGIKYVARMDSDDVAYPVRIQKQVLFLESNLDVDVCGTSCREFGTSYALSEKHLPETHENLVDFSISRCPFIHPTVMFRASVFEGGIKYPTNTELTEDMALWFILLANGFRFHNINVVLLDYRLDENTIKRRRGIRKAISEFAIRMTYMFKLRKVSFRNILLISSRMVFHVLPLEIMKYAYKKIR